MVKANNIADTFLIIRSVFSLFLLCGKEACVALLVVKKVGYNNLIN